MAGGISTLHDARATVQEAAGALSEEDAVRETERERERCVIWNSGRSRALQELGSFAGKTYGRRGNRGWVGLHRLMDRPHGRVGPG